MSEAGANEATTPVNELGSDAAEATAASTGEAQTPVAASLEATTEANGDQVPESSDNDAGGNQDLNATSPSVTSQANMPQGTDDLQDGSLFSQIQQQAFANPSTPVQPIHIERPAKISVVHTALAVVPSLEEICIRAVVRNFAEKPKVKDLPRKVMDRIVAILPTNVPLEITSQVIEDEVYWKRCATERWRTCDITQHGSSWKRLYMERNLAEALEAYDNRTDDEGDMMYNLVKLMKLSSKFIGNLVLKQMLCHWDLKKIFDNLPHLLTLGLTYGRRDVGMNFEWSMFGMSLEDCATLAQCLRNSVSIGGNLSTLILSHNLLDDDKLRILATGLLDNPTLTQIDFSHNKIGDRGARALAKVLDSPSSVITHLYLQDNAIHHVGAKALGHALKSNISLMSLNLRLNHLGDEGGKYIVEGLKGNASLQFLNMSSNQLGIETAKAFSNIIRANSSLATVDLSCNNIGPEGGKLIRDVMDTNKTITAFDIRQCQVGQENEFAIKIQASKNNEDLRRKDKKRV